MGKAVWGSTGIAICMLALLVHNAGVTQQQAETFAAQCEKQNGVVLELRHKQVCIAAQTLLEVK